VHQSSAITQDALTFEQCVDEVCGPFEAACKAALAGEPWPSIEDYLAPLPEPMRAPILRELVLLEIHYRRRAGALLEPAAYQARFPQLDAEWLAKAMAVEPRDVEQSAAEAVPVSDTMPRRLGDYQIIREIGRGGMGVVYEAVQESLGRHVALKLLPFSSLLGPTHLERFRREARAAAGLHHTNIVPVFGVGEDAGVHYFAMQYIEGQSLDRVLREVKRLRKLPDAPATHDALASQVADALTSGRFSPATNRDRIPSPVQGRPAVDAPVPAEPQPEDGNTPLQEAPAATSDLSAPSEARYFRAVARVGAQVADALAYAHGQGVLHRDIKPANLLLDTAGAVWITDFGLAKAEGSDGLTSPGDLLGTLRYMAPERFEGRSGPRSDVYSLGLTVYEMLTLRPAYTDVDPAALIESTRRQAPPAPRQFDARIPGDLETIVLKAMAREPGDRYASAGALAEDLRNFLADRPIRARRSSTLEHLWRWCRRNRALASLAAGLLLAVVVLAIGSTVAYVLVGIQRDRALAAEDEKTHKLWESYVEQAHASRLTRQAGQRFGSLEILGKAIDLERSLVLTPEQRLRLRDEIIACLPLVDLHTGHKWSLDTPLSYAVNFDDRLERYAYGDLQGNVRIRRLDNNEEILHLSDVGKPPFYTNPIFSPDGRFLAVPYSGGEEACRIWDLTAGREVMPKVPIYNGAGCREFSPDSRRLALRRPDGSIVLIDLATGQEKRLPKDVIPDQMVFHPEGRQLAFSSLAGQAMIADLETAQSVARFPHEAPTRGIAWSRDGRLLAVGCDDCRIYVYNARHQLLSVLEGHCAQITHLTFSSSGLLASTGWDNTTRLWDPLSGRLLVTALGHGIRFSKDGQQLAFNYHNREVGLWDISDGRECRTLHHGGIGNRTPSRAFDGRCGVDFSPDGRLLVSTGIDGIRLWPVGTAQEVAHLPFDSCQTALFHPRGTSLITYSKSGLRHWPTQPALDQNLVEESSCPDAIGIGPPHLVFVPRGLAHHRACWNHDGSRFAAVDNRRGRALVFDTDKLSEAMVLPHPRVMSVALSLDGKWAATAGATGHGTEVRIWDPNSRELERTLPRGWTEDGVTQVAFSPDSKWFLISGFRDCRLWRVDTWEQERVFPRETITNHIPLAFSRDSRVLAMALSEDRIQLVDLARIQEIASLSAPSPQAITSLCFSPDGSLLAAATLTQEIQLWDLRSIRHHLAQVGQDWDLPSYPERTEPPVPVVRCDVRLDAALLVARANHWLDERDHAHALADLRASLDIDPENAATANFLAWLYVTAPPELRAPDKALPLIRKALQTRPDDPVYRNTLAVVHYRLGEYQNTAKVLEGIARRDKGAAAVCNWLFLAMSYHRLAQADKARDCYFRAISLIPNMKLSQRDADELNAFRTEAETLLAEPAK
jgi:serine/threonine protein kinase/WD40 repeat protein